VLQSSAADSEKSAREVNQEFEEAESVKLMRESAAAEE
jgi:hypothetical protein